MVGLVGCSYVALTEAVEGGVGRIFLCRTSRGSGVGLVECSGVQSNVFMTKC